MRETGMSVWARSADLCSVDDTTRMLTHPSSAPSGVFKGGTTWCSTAWFSQTFPSGRSKSDALHRQPSPARIRVAQLLSKVVEMMRLSILECLTLLL